MSRFSRTLPVNWEGRQGWPPGRSMKQEQDGGMWRWKGSRNPVVKAIFQAQLGRRAYRTVKQLPLAVYERLPLVSQTIAALCVELDAAISSIDLYDCVRVVDVVARQLRASGGTAPEASRDAFVAFGGDALLLQVLHCRFETHRASIGGVTRIGMLHKSCLDVLRELCYNVRFFSESLAANREYLIKCFSHMASDAAFPSAILLAEEILAVKDEVLDLREVPEYVSLVHHFTSRQLVSFCRILAMVVFEAEPMKVVPGDAMNKIENIASLVEINHEVILAIPDILSRLLKLLYHYMLPHSTQVRSASSSAFATNSFEVLDHVDASTLEMTIRNTRRLLSTFEGNDVGTLLHEYMADETAEVDIMAEDRTFDISALTALSTPEILTALSAIPAPEIFNLQNQVEVLFVLCALCGSKKRDQVQDTLAHLGLVDVLDRMFDKLDWGTSHNLAKPGGIHGQGCECNPKSALKIQYLSLIHNFCDRDSCNKANKHLLLRPSGPRVRKDDTSSPNQASSDGLMIKVVNVLIQEPAESMYRFWLASCVEAFLRGADVWDQVTIASTGLMEHLLAEILRGGFSCASSLQINFDLLGELLKFNRILFAKFTNLLTGDKFDKFAEALVTNLVDSNVFIRSVLLSLERFKCWRQEDIFSPSIVTFIVHNEFQLLRDLMCAVPFGDVNQDNICVLNTALIMFILAERNGHFETYVQVLKRTAVDGSMHLLHKFRQLLTFWKHYYLRKPGRDSLTLQYSTNIPFEEWLRIVELLSKEPDDQQALADRVEDLTH